MRSEVPSFIPADETEDKPKPITRRSFFKKTAAGAAGFFIAQEAIEAVGSAQMVTEQNETKIRRVNELVRHISGDAWELKSRAEDGEYYLSFKNALFEKSTDARAGGRTGEFRQNIDPMTRLGTFTTQSVPRDVQRLLDRHKSQLGRNTEISEALQSAAHDKGVNVVLEQFLKDGGNFRFGHGHYSPKPLEIEFGDSLDLENQRVAYHELLHYFFDRIDAKLSENHSSTGQDHFAIDPLQSRFKMIALINNGQIPLDEKNHSLYGFTTDGSLGDELNKMILANDLTSLQALVESDRFFTNYVHSGMVAPLSSNEFHKNHRQLKVTLSDGRKLLIRENYLQAEADSVQEKEDSQAGGGQKWVIITTKNIKTFDLSQLTSHIAPSDLPKVGSLFKEYAADVNKDRENLPEDVLHDLAYLESFNAAILQQSLRLAIIMSREKNISIEKIYELPEYKSRFNQFLSEFCDRQSQNQKSPARRTAFAIVDQVIGKR